MNRELYRRVASLSERQRNALAKKLQQFAPSLLETSSRQTSSKLVGYVVAKKDTAELDIAAIRDAIKSKLPSYMVPTALMQLSEMPLSPNGKIDVKALPLPQLQRFQQFQQASDRQTSGESLPETPLAETLLQIWRDVLGVSSIGIHDNFFELGGDSILSIQIVSRSREAGLKLAPNQLFEQPTVAELAAAVNRDVESQNAKNQSVEVAAKRSAITGPVPLTPIQHWFFEQEMVAPEHWHQAILVSIPPTVDLAARRGLVERAIATLWKHHDALRLCFSPSKNGWQQTHLDVNNAPKPIHKDLSNLASAERYNAIKTYGSKLHAGFDLVAGGALQAMHFTFEEQNPSWLLVSVHHLVVDGVSWRILQRDLQALLTASSSEFVLPDKTTAFKTWAETLVEKTEQRQSELSFWENQLSRPQVNLPQDKIDIKPATEGSSHTATVHLGAEETRKLLRQVPAAYNTQINDLLLAALAKTLLQWSFQRRCEAGYTLADKTEQPFIRLDVESHGREQLASSVDLSRTVGWFTAVYPVALRLPSSDEPGALIKAVKEQLRQVPDRGIGYGMLRYLGCLTIRQRLAQFAPSEVLFNYLGQLDLGQVAQSFEVEKRENNVHFIKDVELGQLRDPRNRRSYLLEINAWISDGQLHLNWTHDAQRHHPDTISAVACNYLKVLESLIIHCSTVGLADESSRFAPSDFPDVDITAIELDRLVEQLPGKSAKNIEAIYPLTQLQQSFLWNSLRRSSQAGLLHMRGTLHGDLDVLRLKQAWNRVVSRHFALRTSVHWQAIAQPLQVVEKSIALPWQQMDWRARRDQAQALTEFLERDRALGFDFTQAPIARLTLIRLGDRQYEMVWSCHHLMLDGWSGALVVNQVLDSYEALCQKTPDSYLENADAQLLSLSYQDYIRWLQQQDLTTAEHFWRERLKGFTLPTPLPVRAKPTAAVEPQEDTRLREETELLPVRLQSQALSVEETAELKDFLRSHRITLNTLMQGVWACLLSVCSARFDVLFGATVSGRQVDLAGVESVVGLLINVIPVRVEVSKREPVLSWLETLQTQQAATSPYAHVATPQIQAWSDCARRLFNSLLVIENYPVSPANGRSLQLKNLQSGIISAYELTVVVKPGERLVIFANGKSASENSIQALLSDFKQLLKLVVENPTLTVQQLCALFNKEQLLLPVQSETKRNPYPSQPGEVTDLAANLLELQLIKIWESVLGVSPLSADATFFDLGGDSLLAVQLFNQMQQQLNCTLPLSALFQAPTVRQFAALLSQNQPIFWSSLVPIQPKGSKRPFFFHGGSADALTWVKFSQKLGSDQPFYALQRPDLDGSAITQSSVEDLAAACIHDIQTIQPSGPYIIGGHCFGGAVAYEIARQLEAQGETVASLIEIDAYCPNALPLSKLSQLQEQLQLGYFILRKSLYYHGGRNLAQLPQKIWQRLKRSSPRPLPHAPAPSTLQTPSSQNPTIPYEDRYAIAHQANIHAAERYHPKQLPSHYSGAIKIFRAAVQILDWRFGYALGWQIISKQGETDNEIKITEIPGLFGNLFNQRSGPMLAQQVKAHLDSLQ